MCINIIDRGQREVSSKSVSRDSRTPDLEVKSHSSNQQLWKLAVSCSTQSLPNDNKKEEIKTVWPSGLRRWLQAPVRKGVGSNPTAVSNG